MLSYVIYYMKEMHVSAEIPIIGFINWKAIFPLIGTYLIKTPTVHGLYAHVRNK